MSASCVSHQASDRHCQVFDFGPSCCGDAAFEIGGCSTARIKGKLKPIKITSSSAKFRVTVPRQSLLDDPLASGWTMSISRAGNGQHLADYTIEEFDRSTDQAVFFIDDVVRYAKKGYYVATINKDCCKVGQIVMHLECDKATDFDVTSFTHDPCPQPVCNLPPKPAECEPVCHSGPAIADPCGTCDYIPGGCEGIELAAILRPGELEELNEECGVC